MNKFTTREEAKHEIVKHPSRWHYYLNDKKMLRHIDKIYDGFESRTCENCKHYSLEDIWGNADDKYWICLNQLPHATVVSNPPKDFGCNKWEAKCGTA